MRLAISAAIVPLVLAASSTALADATPTGVEVGLRAGYGIPLGDAEGAPAGGQSVKLSDAISGRIPIWVDAGYRLNPNIYIGAFFQYGIMSINTGTNSPFAACSQNGVSCSAHDIQLGAMFAYHLMPDQTIDPWGGVGVGYEILSTSESASGLPSTDTSLKGLQFFNLQLGADYKVLPNLGIGPFVSFSLGSYSSGSSGGQDIPNFQSGTHEWLNFGLRGVYDINL